MRLKDLAPVWVNPHYIAKRSLKRKIEESATLARGKLLDVGCGQKPFQSFFNHVTEYIGLDLPDIDSKADVFARAENLPFEDDSFDTILCTEVLEHLPDPTKFFQEASRVLKVDGHLILTTSFISGLHGEPHDYFRYTPHALRFLAEQAEELGVVRIESTCGTWAMLGQRLSSFIFSQHGKTKPLWQQAIVITLCGTIQLGALLLDGIYRHRGDTLDYLLVCKKINGFVKSK